MKAIWMKKGIMTLMTAAVTMSPERVASEPDHWEYEASQDFTVTSDGVYQFELYGAQGGSYQEHTAFVRSGIVFSVCGLSIQTRSAPFQTTPE